MMGLMATCNQSDPLIWRTLTVICPGEGWTLTGLIAQDTLHMNSSPAFNSNI